MLFHIKLFNKIKPKAVQNHYRVISGLNLWNRDFNSEIKHKIERYWCDKLTMESFNENNTKEEKYYVLPMFPYPSGNLHMGHVRVYTISDAIARFQRLNGKNVLHPIAWDAFGLPAENAAIERNIAPDEWTLNNIANMKAQLIKLGCSFEWKKEFNTSDPSYYRWTQDLFLKLFDAGLVYQKEAAVNWDPVDATVLADEQVDENGCSWRSGAKIEKKKLKQWFIRTTKFAKALLDGLDDAGLQDWRDVIKLQQHWIGVCNGVNFDFKFQNNNDFVTLWTSTPEYIKFLKFVAIKHDHILSKTGGDLLHNGTVKLNLKLIHPLTQDLIPVYVTDEIEYLPLTDSFMGIPNICPKSENFVRKYNIPFEKIEPFDDKQRKIMQENICKEASSLNVGGYWSSAKLRDWLISRQRFWGTPIPIIHCSKCGPQPVPRADLPVQLPKLNKLSEKGCSHLENLDWVNTTCPKCQEPAKRETDTMDTFVDSSWYFLRYLDSQNANQMFDTNLVKNKMPVDLYIGGKEHAVLHLYYARFISYFLHSINLLPTKEPFKRLLVQGMVMGQSYRIKGTGEYVSKDQVEIVDKKKNKAIVIKTGQPVTISWEKMSKSKHNGIDPDEMFNEYGIDTTRLLILADVAPTSHRNWNSKTFPGILNWQNRLWLTMRDFLQYRHNLPSLISAEEFKKHDNYMFDSRNYYLKGVTFNYCGSQQHSVAISKQQGLTNSIRRVPPIIFATSPQFERALACQIILLAPMAPHFASELWSGFVSAPNRLNNSGEILWDGSVFEQNWPKVDSLYNFDLVCEINGLELCVVKIPKSDLQYLTKEEALAIALKQKEVQRELDGHDILNTTYDVVPDYDNVINIKTNGIVNKKKLKKKPKKAVIIN